MLKSKHDLANEACAFLIKNQIGDEKLWAKLALQFKLKTDKKGQYKGEYWGKIMRGAALIQKYTQNDELYHTLEKTVRDMISYCTEEGLSAYDPAVAFTGWDLWSRKYVAVGLEYFYDVCRSEELKKEILNALDVHLSAIIKHIGKEEGKKNICDASGNWGGLNSCSILKAFVVAYELTGKKKFLDFADYIVSTGGSKDFDFLQAAKDNVLPLNAYRYPKAYECTSFFEGLLEYAKVTDNSEILTACKNYGRAILKEDYTVVGGGATNCECFSFSSATQIRAQTVQEQETCVTVSYMLYFNELRTVDADPIWTTAIERSFYNAYLGALNETAPSKTHGLPIDWYSPLVNGKRANWVVAGRQTFSDNSKYSCCTAIGPAGLGVFLDSAVTREKNGIRFDQYVSHTYDLGDVKICEKTDYPVSSDITFTIEGNAKNVDLFFKIPVWCKDFSLYLNDKRLDLRPENGYAKVNASLSTGDKIVLDLPLSYGFAFMTSTRFRGGLLYFTKGPFILAADRRYTRIHTAFTLMHRHEPDFDFRIENANVRDSVCSAVVRYKGKKLVLVDYASAGDTYDHRSELNVFIPYRTPDIWNQIVCCFDRRIKI